MDAKNRYDFDNVLELCKLHISASKEKDALVSSVCTLLEWVDSLKEIHTDNVAPMVSPSQNFSCPRKDIPGDALRHSEVLDNAIHKNLNYIIIPKLK